MCWKTQLPQHATKPSAQQKQQSGESGGERKVNAAKTLDCSNKLPVNLIALVGAGGGSKSTFVVTLTVNIEPVTIEVYTCAEVTIASSTVYNLLWRLLLSLVLPQLRAYGETNSATLGQCRVNVDYNGQHQQLSNVFVLSPTERGLFGRPWINAFNAVTVNSVAAMPELSELLIEFRDVFKPSTGFI